MLDESITVEDCLNAIGNEIVARNILSASRMNKAIVVFLREESMVEFWLSVDYLLVMFSTSVASI